jgi:hypothetical protein
MSTSNNQEKVSLLSPQRSEYPSAIAFSSALCPPAFLGLHGEIRDSTHHERQGYKFDNERDDVLIRKQGEHKQMENKEIPYLDKVLVGRGPITWKKPHRR